MMLKSNQYLFCIAMGSILSLGACSEKAQEGSNSNIIVSGLAALGPIANAEVNCYSVDDEGKADKLLGTDAATSSDGTYSLPLVLPAGVEKTDPMLCKVSGGTYVDEATGEAITNSEEIAVMLSEISMITEDYSEGLGISALTSIQVEMVAKLLAAGEETDSEALKAAIENANNFLEASIGFDPNLMPANIYAEDFDPESEAGKMAYFLAGLSQMTEDLNMDHEALIAAFAGDALDGSFDGKMGLEDIAFVNEDGQTVNFDDALGSDNPMEKLSESLVAFMEGDFAPELDTGKEAPTFEFEDAPTVVDFGLSDEELTAAKEEIDDAGIGTTIEVPSTTPIEAPSTIVESVT